MTLGVCFRAAVAVLVLFSGPIGLNAAAAKLLMYQRNGKGFVHDNLAASAAALREIATELHLEVVVSANASVFTDANLKQFGAVVFANSNNDAFENDEQRAVFRR